MAAVTYQCPNCGGALTFTPETQGFSCEYCGSQFTEADFREQAQPAEQDAAPQAQAESAGALYECPSCGAQIVTDGTTAATFCFYCHNSVVLQGRLSGQYRPDGVIPFAIDREGAVQRFRDWIKHKRFLPRAFVKESQIEKLCGVYFPYWMVDCDVRAQMEAMATRIRVWRTGKWEYTETKYFRLSRAGEIHLQDLTHNALKKADVQLAQGVLPYDFSAVKPFTMRYLSGFLAEKRDVEREELGGVVQADINQYSSNLLMGTAAGYDMVKPTSVTAEVAKDDWRYTLLPVWTMTYRDRKGTLYYYSLNGQTGKVCGKLPVNYIKLASVCAGISAAVFALLSAIGLLWGYFI